MCKLVRRKHKRLVSPRLHVRLNDRSTSTREWNDFRFLELVLLLASLTRTCKLRRRKHKHKRKERKLKNSEKLSVYILVRHVGIKSGAKRQSSVFDVLVFCHPVWRIVTVWPVSAKGPLLLLLFREIKNMQLIIL